ncbi:MAG: Lrp/AsnC ligand binding domain-containing protein [Nitrososphaerales archaeon]|jgi:DNA-binding Lrp family transcriptional regulator
MTLSACILIKTVPLQTESVLEKTKSLKGVRKAFVAYGRYDMVAFVEASGYPEIRKLTGEINSARGVRSTETLVQA